MVTINIKHIKKAKNKYGRIYYYDRITGKRLRSEPGTTAFINEVEMIRANTEAMPKGEHFGYLVIKYKQSPEYKRLAARTKSDYNKILNYLKPLHDLKLNSIDAPYISKIKNKAAEKHGRHFANYVVSIFSLIFNWGIEPGITTANPAAKVRKIKKPRNAPVVNRAWKDYEIEIYKIHGSLHLQVAFALGQYVGLREGDMCRLPLSAVANDYIELRQSKNGKEIKVPIHRDLKQFLEAAKNRTNKKALTVVVGLRGLPYTEAGFRAMFFRDIRKLEAEGLIGKGLTFHGLRHTVGTNLADAGASDAVIQAILGHTTPNQAREYRRNADQKKGARRAVTIMQRKPKK